MAMSWPCSIWSSTENSSGAPSVESTTTRRTKEPFLSSWVCPSSPAKDDEPSNLISSVSLCVSAMKRLQRLRPTAPNVVGAAPSSLQDGRHEQLHARPQVHRVVEVIGLGDSPPLARILVLVHRDALER